MEKELTPYDKYKTVNLPWLQKIPFHWDFIRAKNLLIEQKEIVGDLSANYKLLSLTKQNIIYRDLENAKGKFPKEFNTYKVVGKDNIVFCLFDVDETPRTVGISKYDGMITGAYDVFTTVDVNPHFLYYYFLSIDDIKGFRPLYTGLRKVVKMPVFLSQKTPIPPRPEQDQIVRFLDFKISRINKFIKAKKREIELLKELKQAAINSAVTKGLNPNVPMKDSEIEWLGQIPAHWETKPIKRLARSNIESLSNNASPDLEISYLDISAVGFGYLKQTPTLYKFKDAPSRARRVVHSGDIIISTVRTYLKSFCFIDDNLSNNIVSTGFAVLSPFPNINPKFLSYGFSSDYFINYVIKNSIGISYPSINENKLMSLKLAIPNINEQEIIVKHLESTSSRYNRSIDSINKELIQIQEYKASLISEVVTGKVDVRDIKIDDDFDASGMDEQPEEIAEEQTTEEQTTEKQ